MAHRFASAQECVQVVVRWGDHLVDVAHLPPGVRWSGDDGDGSVQVSVGAHDGRAVLTQGCSTQTLTNARPVIARLGNLSVCAMLVAAPPPYVRSRSIDRRFCGAVLGASMLVAAMLTILASTRTTYVDDPWRWIVGSPPGDEFGWRTVMGARVAGDGHAGSGGDGTAEGAQSGAHSGRPARDLSSVRRRHTSPFTLRYRVPARVFTHDRPAQRGVLAALAQAARIGAGADALHAFDGMLSARANRGESDETRLADGHGGLGFVGTGAGAGLDVGLGPAGSILSPHGLTGLRGYGTGSGEAYGASAGHGLRERRSVIDIRCPGPNTRCSAPSITGYLSPEAIRRVVLRNLGQVHYCEEETLRRGLPATGRVSIRFIVGDRGNVLGSRVVENSGLADSAAQCVANAVRRWCFPEPAGGGVVTVNYPFVLQVDE